MSIQVKKIEDQIIWDDFLASTKPNTFLQSWAWGEFNKRNGEEVVRLGCYKEDMLCGIALVILIRAKRGSFLLIPHGPIIQNDTDYKDSIKAIVDYLKNINEYNICSFIRICPLKIANSENEDLFLSLSFKQAPIHMHPELAWMIDLKQNEDEILKGMRKTTRHAIKKAESEGVEIIASNDPDDIDKFLEVYNQTVSRQHFVPFSKKYLLNEFNEFNKDQQIQYYFAQYNNKIISAAIIIFDKNGAYYHHGASTHEFPNIPGSQLLQWEAIKQAKQKGCQIYNFWGIAPDENPNHPWAGLSRFKKGFGGYAEEYVHAKDYVLKMSYWLNWVIEYIRRKKRRL
ncbi:MAG: lipid II:glycine glycyltransferase FemX [Patescibacteria group bacterium]